MREGGEQENWARREAPGLESQKPALSGRLGPCTVPAVWASTAETAQGPGRGSTLGRGHSRAPRPGGGAQAEFCFHAEAVESSDAAGRLCPPPPPPPSRWF